jgi:hypothetical protein
MCIPSEYLRICVISTRAEAKKARKTDHGIVLLAGRNASFAKLLKI